MGSLVGVREAFRIGDRSELGTACRDTFLVIWDLMTVSSGYVPTNSAIAGMVGFWVG